MDSIRTAYIQMLTESTGKLVDATDTGLYQQRDSANMNMHSDNQVMDALNTDATSTRIMGKGHKFKEGDLVGVRLNINVLKNTGVPVLTLHAPTNKSGYRENKGFYNGEAKQYAHTATLKNAYFNVNQTGRENIATGQVNKFPMASVDGEYTSLPPNFNGVEIRFNPMNHHLFVDGNGNAVKSAEEVTLHGHRAYARGKIEYHTAATEPKRSGDAPTMSKLMEDVYTMLENLYRHV